MRKPLLSLILPWLPAALFADPDVHTAPAVQLSYETEAGRFHQLQVREGADWRDLGTAVKGTGRAVTNLLPAGQYRVVTLTRK